MIIRELELLKELKQEVVISVILVILGVVFIVVDILWWINPAYDMTAEEDYIIVESEITKILSEVSVFYSEKILCGIELQNGKTLLITENQETYLEENLVYEMEKGKKVLYKISKEKQDRDYYEVEELCYDGKILYSVDDYNNLIQSSRKSSWVGIPLMFAGICILVKHIHDCLKDIKMLTR